MDTDIQKNRQTDAGRQVGRHTYTHANKQTDRQIDKIDRHTQAGR